MIWLISGFAFPFGEAGSELDPEERIAPLRLPHDALLPDSIHGPRRNLAVLCLGGDVAYDQARRRTEPGLARTHRCAELRVQHPPVRT